MDKSTQQLIDTVNRLTKQVEELHEKLRQVETEKNLEIEVLRRIYDVERVKRVDQPPTIMPFIYPSPFPAYPYVTWTEVHGPSPNTITCGTALTQN